MHRDHSSFQHFLQNASLIRDLLFRKDNDFNIFSVLRADHDERNLHSRFLSAVLDQPKSRDDQTSNLSDFVQNVVRDSKFETGNAVVEREKFNIDILIRNVISNQAIILENKIWAKDQNYQLQRYYNTLKDKGYEVSAVLYLTLDGHSPDDHSAGEIDVKNMSYVDDILPWLDRCHERAYNNPNLRESIAQYIRLIKKLTSISMDDAYIDKLKDLILEEGNLILLNDLNEAFRAAKTQILTSFYDQLKREFVNILPTKSPDIECSDTSEIKSYFNRSRAGSLSLYYQYEDLGDGVYLEVSFDPFLWYGIGYEKHVNKKYWDRLKENLIGFDSESQYSDNHPWWKWFREDINLRNPSREALELFASTSAIDDIAKEIVEEFSGLISHYLKD